MATATDEQVRSGLEGVVAFATEIAEPDKEGSALRYRGVDIEDLVGNVPFEQVWGLLVDGAFLPGLPPAEPWPLTVRTGDPRVDVQAALAMLAPEWGLAAADRHLRRAGAHRSRPRLRDGAVVRRAVRARHRPPAGSADGGRQGEVDPGALPDQVARRGRPRPREGDRRILDSAAEHGMNASTFTARVIASTGRGLRPRRCRARSARCPARCTAARPRACCRCSTTWSARGDPVGYVKQLLDRGDRLMGFGHRVYRAEDPRARVLRRTGKEIGSPRFEAAEALEKAALAELQARKPDRVLATNVEFWSAVVLDHAAGPAGDLHPDVHLRARRRAGRRTSWSRSARAA